MPNMKLFQADYVDFGLDTVAWSSEKVLRAPAVIVHVLSAVVAVRTVPWFELIVAHATPLSDTSRHLLLQLENFIMDVEIFLDAIDDDSRRDERLPSRTPKTLKVVAFAYANVKAISALGRTDLTHFL